MEHKGTVYLIHFDQPIGSGVHGQAQHYIGFANGEGLEARIERHRNGNGSRIMAAVVGQYKIGFRVVRTWENVDRNFERKLKNQKNAPRLCPLCGRRDG